MGMCQLRQVGFDLSQWSYAIGSRARKGRDGAGEIILLIIKIVIIIRRARKRRDEAEIMCLQNIFSLTKIRKHIWLRIRNWEKKIKAK